MPKTEQENLHIIEEVDATMRMSGMPPQMKTKNA